MERNLVLPLGNEDMTGAYATPILSPLTEQSFNFVSDKKRRQPQRKPKIPSYLRDVSLLAHPASRCPRRPSLPPSATFLSFQITKNVPPRSSSRSP